MTLHSGKGGAKYFELRKARKDFLYVDNGNAEDFKQDYYIAIRSNYLPLRRGEHFIFEPYSPHRFSRQFGYYQEIPGVLTHDIRKTTLDDGIRYWRLCTLSKTMSKNIESLINSKLDTLMEGEETDKEGDPFNKEAYNPSGESKRKSHSHHLEESGNSNADHHWKRQRKNFKPSKPRNNFIINSSSTEVFVKELEKEILDIDDDDELQDGQETIVGPNSLDIVISNAETTRNEESIRSFNKFDISQLEKLLKALFDKANAYDEARSTFSEKTSKELLAQQLDETKDRLYNAQTREIKEANQIRSTEEQLESIEKELENLKERRKNLCASLKRQQQLLQSAQTEVHEIEEKIIAIENDLLSSDEAIENLKTAAAHLESSKEELKSLDPFA
ncbi:hypothetical protein CDL12_13383 [Handroanthus impetiginosus]|uniref:Uncharacterized protein n=1 Tax=Handroanthus impetiginosus TaxID=429701 RepID=A0A2G9H8Y2_9LAMI|nr:hypothetical protein CDL12_13383 [Handroanthus impetiginosus]